MRSNRPALNFASRQAYPTGVMSKHFDELKVGDSLDCKGPMIKLPYEANKWQAIGMVAGGTGITPMLQVIEEVLRNPADKTQLSLVFGNVTQEDILLKSRLDALAAKHPGRFKLLYVLDKPPKGWKGGAGYVTPAMLKEALPPPGEKHLVLVCGPPGAGKSTFCNGMQHYLTLCGARRGCRPAV